MSKPKLPSRIGRYRVAGIVGTGTQGIVLQGFDESLQRNVAIKVLRADASREEAARLVGEARSVSRLHHPNVVTLLDFGLFGRKPFLVFELLEGVSLREELTTRGALGVRRAVILMSQILGGVAAAHDHGIVHCDLSPNNIFLSEEDRPKVMDFGLSTTARRGDENSLMGTPRYLYPEPFLRRPLGPQSDVFALGSIFYEMLIGEPQFAQTSRHTLFDAIVNGAPRLPSEVDPDVPPVVDEIVGRALAREPSERFANARAMKEMLDQYRIPRGKSDTHSTVDFLQRRLKHAPGFSALAGRMNDVLRLTSSDGGGDARRLASMLVKDVTLTQRVLTTANSALHGGREVTTLSRAVVALGLAQVRHCVMSSLLQAQFSSGSSELRVAQVASFFSAVLSKQLTTSLHLRRAEDAFLCGMFHGLGKMLVMHYFPEEYSVIRRAATDRDSEITASRDVLGLPYHEIGQQTARQWKLPATIIDAMMPLPRGPVPETEDEAERIGRVAALSNAIADVLVWGDEDPRAEIGELLKKARPAIPIDWMDLTSLLPSTVEVARKYAHLVGAADDAARILDGARALSEPDLDSTLLLDIAATPSAPHSAGQAPSYGEPNVA